jgi:hypothetical protein
MAVVAEERGQSHKQFQSICADWASRHNNNKPLWVRSYFDPHGCSNRSRQMNVVKTIINHPIFDRLYHPFMVILGIVYYCFNMF